jgi:hypothetical protein
VAAVATAVALVVATTPAVADPNAVASTSPTSTPSGVAVAGAGGYGGQVPVVLPKGTVSAAHPLRVVVLGDSVMQGAYFGINAALSATGEAYADPNSIPGFGLTTATNWPTSIPNIIRHERPQIILASWSWDQDGPTTPNALHQPAAYTALLRRALTVMLAPGDGVDGVIFTQFPVSGEIAAANPSDQSAYNKARSAGLAAWNNIAAKMPSDFPGRVMYLPVGSSLLLDGHFSSWLPPVGHPKAPADQWTRVRKLDNVHLCPEGVVRYASAILSDLTAIFDLTPATPSWTAGSWTSNPVYNNPPGGCPDDHPPNRS